MGGRYRRQRQRQNAKGLLDGLWLTADDTDPEPAPRDPFVDYPPLLRMVHPTWWHVYRIESRGPVLIAECRHENSAHWIMARERWRTRMTKWKCETFESFHPLKPGGIPDV